jgi:hypothetical protein
MKSYPLSPALAQRVEKAFQEHPITQEQQQRLQVINDKCMHLARFLAGATPECPEQARMLNYIKNAQLMAEESIRKNEA